MSERQTSVLMRIDITQKMIDAGVAVFARYDPPGDLAEETVSEIFQEMLLAWHQDLPKMPQGVLQHAAEAA